MSSRVFVAFLLATLASSSFGQDCGSAPCEQNADCVEDGLGYFCQCPVTFSVTYSGQNCETPITSGAACNLNYYDSEGTITSPNYPNEYTGRLNCYSHLKIATAEEITLTLEVFETEALKDGLYFGAGPDIYEDIPVPAIPDIFLLEGNLTGLPLENRTYTFSTNQIFFYFNTDKNIPARGYLISYTADIDSCIVGDPCLNNGTCVDGYYNYTCNCPMGYTGRNCEMEIDECGSMPCQNGGSCMDLVNGHFCQCITGFGGDFCQLNDDDCATDPCLNGGTCNDGIGGFTCTCAPGWTDGECQTNIDECASNPCENGGTCMDEINMYTCTCAPGYTDGQCQTDIDECNSSPCENGGSCNDLINMFTCDCVPGFSGVFCGNNTNECASVPCMNDGICVDGINEYECLCTGTGFEGLQCETNIDDCAPTNPCLNGGTCNDGINDYNCTCMPGFTGDDCGININECQSDPCENGGTCNDGMNSYMCDCAAGWTGPVCDQNIDECDPDPCQNGGTCMDGINQYTCYCAPGYTDDMCQTNIDECLSLPCENNGTCVDEVNGFTCMCPPDTSGDYCQTSLNACMSYPCINGGTCVNVGADFVCECPPGYAGYYCEIDINECASLPCQNGATCNDSIAMFTCQCRFGYSGIYCEEIGFCDLEGVWYNECNDKLTITQTSTGMLLGDYSTYVEQVTGVMAPTVALGFAGRDCPIPTFGFTVSRNNGKSTTSWTGQCQLCDQQEVLYTTWINTVAVTTCSEIKQATKIGQDKWTRYMQSQAPREDM